ncbi:hypothetical protein [Clostridium chromiireducens]|nr:hypothetical protein [Clostridium chromiireducens]
MTSKTGTTFTEEIPTVIFFNATLRKRVPSLSGMEYISNYKSSLRAGYL